MKASVIKKLITGEDSERMPPLKSDNPQLSNEQIELLKRCHPTRGSEL